MDQRLSTLVTPIKATLLHCILQIKTLMQLYCNSFTEVVHQVLEMYLDLDQIHATHLLIFILLMFDTKTNKQIMNIFCFSKELNGPEY